MSNDINTLREALFATLAGLREGTTSIEQAKAISELSQTIINSAKVEVDYLRVRGGEESSPFLSGGEPPALPGVHIMQHRIK
jgi:hypothetical protein